MIEVDSFVLRNIVHFNEAKVPVRKNNGFVVISGLNKDSRIATDQNNGAGKSLLWSALPNALYAAAPSSTLKNTKKDMLDSSKSEIEIRLTNNVGKKVKIVQKPSKWHIFEEDDATGKLKDIKSHRLANQQDKIAEHFPVSQDEFYAYTYLSSIQGQRIHFQVDKPAERLKFITSIFQLDAYDKLKKYFTTMLGKIKDEQTKFNVLESKLLNVNTQLEKIAWNSESKAEASEAKKKFSGMKEERDLLARQVATFETLVKQIKSLVRMLEKREELAEELSEGMSVEQAESKLLKRKTIIREYEAYKKQQASYEKSIARHTEKLAELEALKLPSVSDINKKLDTLRTQGEELITEIEQAREISSRKVKWEKIYSTCKEELAELGFKSVKKVDMDSDIESDISIYRSTLKLKKLLNTSKDSVCPTCMQDVDLSSISSSVKKAEAKLAKLESLLDARQLVCRLRDAKKELKSLGESRDVSELRENLDYAKAKVKKLEDDLRTLRKIGEIKEELSHIEPPEAPAKKPGKNSSMDDIDELLSVCRELSKIEHAISVMVEDNPDLEKAQSNPSKYSKKAKKKLEALSVELSAMDEEYKRLSKKVSEFDLRLGEYRVLSKQKLELDAEVEQIKPLLAKRDLYKALEKAYSAKGLKVAKANEIVRLLESNLNRYSNLVFAEPFEFFVFATEQGVFCEVDRGKGKRTDVRLLSGAESESFKLLFMLSLLLMVPSERRTNFVVLDEPDSHMDNRTLTLFAERFIPFLREVVPHVFLITPKDHHIYSDAERWVIVKENGVSTLNRKSLIRS